MHQAVSECVRFYRFNNSPSDLLTYHCIVLMKDPGLCLSRLRSPPSLFRERSLFLDGRASNSFHGREISYLSPLKRIVLSNSSYTVTSLSWMPSDSKFNFLLNSWSVSGETCASFAIVCVTTRLVPMWDEIRSTGPARIHPSLVWIAVGPLSALMISPCSYVLQIIIWPNQNINSVCVSSSVVSSVNSTPVRWG